MVSLKASWQTQKNQRQQELVQRQQQVCESLTEYQQERQTKAAALRHDLNLFQQSLQQETQDFLIDLSLDHQLRSERVAQQLKSCYQERNQKQMQLMQNLATYIASLQEQVQTYLVELELARQERRQQVGQMLQESRDRRLAETAELFQQLSEFRTELKAYCNSLHETVWGKSQAIQPLEPAIQKPVTLKSDRATAQTSAQKPVAHPVAQPVTQPAQPSLVKLFTTTIPKDTEPVVVVKQHAPPTLQPDATLLEQKLYSYIKQIEGARLTEIQSGLGINRSQTVDSLRALIKQGLITQRDRVYLAQEEISL